MSLLLGVDVGTTGTKALLVDDQGAVLGKGYREYALLPGPDGRVEQRAEDWWDAVVCAVQAAVAGQDARQVCALSLSTQGASMLAVDDAFRPLGNVITWMDARAEEESRLLDRAVGGEAIYRKSGWGLGPDLDAAKILWLRRQEPELFAAARSFVSTLEFINVRLTGQNVVDPTNAAIRQLMDIETGRWDPEILQAVGVSENRLPDIVPTGAYIGVLTAEAAALLGLPTSVRVYNGAHDQYCASLGCGAVRAGDALLSTGTTWVLLAVTDRLLYTESRVAPGIHPVPGLFGAMASMVSAGCALKWYRDLVEGAYAEFDRVAAERRQAASELLFYPYVAGAGFPHRDAGLGGVAAGMRLTHDQYDLALALMEGVAFEARLMVDELRAAGASVDTLYMSGGAAKSALWAGLTAAATGCRLIRMREDEACCMGAAMIAAVGAGLFPDYSAAASAMVSGLPLPEPDAEARAFYEQKFDRYCRGLPAVRALCKGE